MAEDGKNVRINLAFNLDTSTAQRVAAVIESLGKKGDEAAHKMAPAGQGGVNAIQAAAAKMQQVGLVLTGAATGLSTAMTLAARSYVSQVGTAENASARWLGASKQLELAQMRIGRAVTTSVVPYLEKAADLAERASKFAEDNPQVVNTGVTLVGGAAAAGGLLAGISTTVSAIGKIGPLFQAGGALAFVGKLAGSLGGGIMGAARGVGDNFALGSRLAGLAGEGTLMGGLKGAAAGISPVLGIAGSVLGGVGLGAGLFDLFRDKNKTQSAGTIGGQAMTIAAAALGDLFGKAPEWGRAMGELTGVLQKTTTATQETKSGLDNLPQEISAYYSYQRQTQEAERGQQRQRLVANRDFERQMTLGEEDYLRGRQRSMRDFVRQERITEADYYRQRRLQARDFNIQMERTEYDHQKGLRRSREDHEFALKRIIMEGDGMAFWEENRQYNLSRSREEEDYQLGLSRQQEDFARQRADQAQEYAIQRARRLEEFAQQQKDQEYDYQLQRKRSQEQFRIQMADMEYQFSEERRLRQQALIDNLVATKGALEQERILRQQLTGAMLSDLAHAKDLVNQGKINSLNGQRAGGGYVGAGAYEMHPNEYVLASSTVNAAERLAGGRLTQETILATMAGGSRSAGAGFVYNDYRTFSRGLAPDERNQIRRETEQLLMEVVSGTAL